MYGVRRKRKEQMVKKLSLKTVDRCYQAVDEEELLTIGQRGRE